MNSTTVSICIVTLLMLISSVACERQESPKPIGAATNKHIEEPPGSPSKRAAETLPEAVKTPLDKAYQTEGTIQRAEELTRKQTDEAGR